MRTAIVFGLLVAATPAIGAYFDGNALNELCRSQPMAAFFYVFGASEQMSSACIPAQVEAEQMADVACQYLQSHPAERHEFASTLTTRALTTAWPCQ